MPRHSPCALYSLNFSCSICLSYRLIIVWIVWLHNEITIVFFSTCYGEIVVFPTLQKNLYLFQILAYLLFNMLTICSFYSSFVLFSFQWPQIRCLNYTWWAQVDSNHRPRAYQARALTTWAMSPFRCYRCIFSPSLASGGDDGIRTHDPLLAGQVLSQLSYTPI